jgi:hypothetical protein
MRHFLISISLLCFSNLLFAQNIHTYLLRQAKEIYFALKNEATGDNNQFKAQTVAFKKPNPDPDDINKTELQIAIGNWWDNQFDNLYKYTKEGSKIDLQKLSDAWAGRIVQLKSIAAVKKVLSEWIYDAKNLEKTMSIEDLKTELGNEYSNFSEQHKF